MPKGPEATKTILVVDDDPTLLKMMTKQLEVAGYRVETAKDGNEGLAKVQAKPPDLLIVDLVLPGRTGWHVAHTLRNDPASAKIPIIVMSGLVGPGAPIEGTEVGDAYLEKPFQHSELIAAVQALLPGT